MVDWGCVCHGNKGTKTYFTAQYMPQRMKVEIGLFIPAHSISTFLLHTLYMPGTAKGVRNPAVTRWACHLRMLRSTTFLSLVKHLVMGKDRPAESSLSPLRWLLVQIRPEQAPPRRMGPRRVLHVGKGAFSYEEAYRAQSCCEIRLQHYSSDFLMYLCCGKFTLHCF